MQRSYYAVIPGNVRYDKRLSPGGKLMYGEITALSNERGYCWATNEYFADLYEVEKRTIQRYLERLVEYGYIDITLESGNKRKIRIIEEGCKNSHRGVTKMSPRGENNVTHNIKSNIKSNSLDLKGRSKQISSIQEIFDHWKEVWKHPRLSLKRKEHEIPIEEKLREGYSVEDIKLAISNAKHDPWNNGTESGKRYDRLAVLLGPRFDSHLEAKTVVSKDRVVVDMGCPVCNAGIACPAHPKKGENQARV